MIVLILLILAALLWLIALFARGRADLPDTAFFAVGAIVILCALLILFAHLAASNPDPAWRIP